MLNSIHGIHPDRLTGFISAYYPGYRARQLLHWIYGKHVSDLEQMTDLPSDFRGFLGKAFDFRLPEIEKELISRDSSRKLRLRLADGAMIESVLMPEARKNSLCISTQAGCSRACAFCATGTMGLRRNLESHELVQQILVVAPLSPRRITNLVLMGMGEPLDNLDNVLDFLRLIQHEQSLAFNPRRTTLSICGIVPGIISLADSGVKVKLALSLNSAVDAVRSRIMPVNLRYSLAELKRALQYYQSKSRFRITLEYILIPGLNMSPADLKALRKFSGDLSCKINFIPYNEVPGLPYKVPASAEVEAFMASARTLPQAITLRRSRGSDISGACGQLVTDRSRQTKEKS
jgi:23S rRNA (adenine2503-C2)-methyltransferase